MRGGDAPLFTGAQARTFLEFEPCSVPLEMLLSSLRSYELMLPVRRPLTRMRAENVCPRHSRPETKRFSGKGEKTKQGAQVGCFDMRSRQQRFRAGMLRKSVTTCSWVKTTRCSKLVASRRTRPLHLTRWVWPTLSASWEPPIASPRHPVVMWRRAFAA